MSRSGSASDSKGGTAGTGGFETLLGKIVVDAGLATRDDVDACEALLEQTAGDSSTTSRTLQDLLLENGYVTKHQLDRVRANFEAKKSTSRIPGYKIIKQLGSGAMATVFLAKQVSLERLVAIKVLPKKFSDNENFIERFYKEGRAAAQLNHANIVGAYDVGRAGEHHYFVMEYVDGHTVYDELVKHRQMDEMRAIEIIRQVALALQHAHARGFIHRDIKPKNIMLTSDNVVKLADLGLARAVTDKEAAQAEAGRAYGTPYYISPEQIRGEVEIGPPADIYGLGATFYHMMTGRVPFEGKNPSEVMHKHLKANLTPPDHLNNRMSAGCAQVIEMMMAKRTSERYVNVDDVMHDLDLVAEGRPPHFAKSVLGFEDLGSVLPSKDASHDHAAMPTSASIKQATGGGGSAMDNPTFMIMVVLLALSLVGNLVLALLAFA